jgi:hypothetical protein
MDASTAERKTHPRRLRRAARLSALLVIVLLARAGMAGVAASSGVQLPDLKPAAPYSVEIAPTYEATAGILYITDPTPPMVLRFPTIASNVGQYAVDLLGTPTGDPSADPRTMEAHQCVAWATSVCTARDDVGTLYWHDAHHHWHFNDFALYELRRLTSTGHPDVSATGLVSTATKASFCLEDSVRNDDSDPTALPVGVYNGCTGVIQGVSPGWSDEYGAAVPGQQIGLDGVTDGSYALVITLDPKNRLHETDDTNNEVWVTVQISDGVTHAEIVPNAP